MARTAPLPSPTGDDNGVVRIGQWQPDSGVNEAIRPTERAVTESAVVQPLRSAYLTHLDQVSPDSRQNIAYRLRVAADVLWPGMDAAECPWHEVDAALLTLLRARLQERFQWSSANNFLSTTRSVLRVAWMLGQVTTDQLHRTLAVSLLKGVQLPAGHYVEDEGWMELFAKVAKDRSQRGIRDLAILAVMRGTGCRRSELVRLDVGDVDLRRLLVTFKHTKGNKERESGLPAWAREPLMEWMRLRGPAPGPLFMRFQKSKIAYGSGLSKEGLQDIFKRLVTDAGMPELVTHDMRRGHITTNLAAGIDISIVAKGVGHSNPATTARYDQRKTEALIDAMQRMPSPFGGGSE
jgi:integrase/recombinase XerC